MIKDNYTTPFDEDWGPIPIEPLEIRILQEQLLEIEAQEKDGNFLDENGSIAEGQAILRELLEEGFDLVHDCLIEIENQNNKSTDLIAEAVTQARYVADSIVTQASVISKELAKETRNVSLNTLHTLQSTLSEGSLMLKSAVQHPSDSLKATTNVLASTTRSALGFLGKIYNEFEPVDESLHPVYDKLVSIRNSLKDLRNERDLGKIKNDTRFDEGNLQKRLRALQENLDKVDTSKVDGKFMVDGEVPRGQALLSSLEDECYCLISEVM